MRKIWVYAISALVIFVVAGGVIFWAVSGHQEPDICGNDNSRLTHPLIYIPGRNECFPLYTQGPCKEGNWLTIQGLNVSCSPNTCMGRLYDTNGPNTYVIVPFNQSCYRIGDSCGTNGEVISYGESGYPQCSIKTASGAVGPGGLGGACREGTFRFGNQCHEPQPPLLDYDY